MNYYKVKKIHDWLFTIYDPIGVYCYLIVGKKHALLVDTGHGIEPLDPYIREITTLPYSVVLTHGHWDHAGGAFEFKQVWMNAKDIDIYYRQMVPETRKHILTTYAEVLRDNGVVLCEDTYINVDTFTEGDEITLAHLEDNHLFDLGGITVQMVDMAAHTPGSVGALVVEHGLLLVGDATAKNCWMFLEDTMPMPVYIKMLKRIAAMDIKFFHFSHEHDFFPGADFEGMIRVAENIDPCRAKRYEYKFDTLGGYIYTEGEYSIVFDPKKLRWASTFDNKYTEYFDPL